MRSEDEGQSSRQAIVTFPPDDEVPDQPGPTTWKEIYQRREAAMTKWRLHADLDEKPTFIKPREETHLLLAVKLGRDPRLQSDRPRRHRPLSPHHPFQTSNLHVYTARRDSPTPLRMPVMVSDRYRMYFPDEDPVDSKRHRRREHAAALCGPRCNCCDCGKEGKSCKDSMLDLKEENELEEKSPSQPADDLATMSIPEQGVVIATPDAALPLGAGRQGVLSTAGAAACRCKSCEVRKCVQYTLDSSSGPCCDKTTTTSKWRGRGTSTRPASPAKPCPWRVGDATPCRCANCMPPSARGSTPMAGGVVEGLGTVTGVGDAGGTTPKRQPSGLPAEDPRRGSLLASGPYPGPTTFVDQETQLGVTSDGSLPKREASGRIPNETFGGPTSASSLATGSTTSAAGGSQMGVIRDGSFPKREPSGRLPSETFGAPTPAPSLATDPLKGASGISMRYGEGGASTIESDLITQSDQLTSKSNIVNDPGRVASGSPLGVGGGSTSSSKMAVGSSKSDKLVVPTSKVSLVNDSGRPASATAQTTGSGSQPALTTPSGGQLSVKWSSSAENPTADEEPPYTTTSLTRADTNTLRDTEEAVQPLPPKSIMVKDDAGKRVAKGNVLVDNVPRTIVSADSTYNSQDSSSTSIGREKDSPEHNLPGSRASGVLVLGGRRPDSQATGLKTTSSGHWKRPSKPRVERQRSISDSPFDRPRHSIDLTRWQVDEDQSEQATQENTSQSQTDMKQTSQAQIGLKQTSQGQIDKSQSGLDKKQDVPGVEGTPAGSDLEVVLPPNTRQRSPSNSVDATSTPTPTPTPTPPPEQSPDAWKAWYQQSARDSADWGDGGTLYRQMYHPEDMPGAIGPDEPPPTEWVKPRSRRADREAANAGLIASSSSGAYKRRCKLGPSPTFDELEARGLAAERFQCLLDKPRSGVAVGVRRSPKEVATSPSMEAPYSEAEIAVHGMDGPSELRSVSAKSVYDDCHCKAPVSQDDGDEKEKTEGQQEENELTKQKEKEKTKPEDDCECQSSDDDEDVTVAKQKSDATVVGTTPKRPGTTPEKQKKRPDSRRSSPTSMESVGVKSPSGDSKRSSKESTKDKKKKKNSTTGCCGIKKKRGSTASGDRTPKSPSSIGTGSGEQSVTSVEGDEPKRDRKSKGDEAGESVKLKPADSVTPTPTSDSCKCTAEHEYKGRSISYLGSDEDCSCTSCDQPKTTSRCLCKEVREIDGKTVVGLLKNEACECDECDDDQDDDKGGVEEPKKDGDDDSSCSCETCHCDSEDEADRARALEKRGQATETAANTSTPTARATQNNTNETGSKPQEVEGRQRQTRTAAGVSSHPSKTPKAVTISVDVNHMTPVTQNVSKMSSRSTHCQKTANIKESPSRKCKPDALETANPNREQSSRGKTREVNERQRNRPRRRGNKDADEKVASNTDAVVSRVNTSNEMPALLVSPTILSMMSRRPSSVLRPVTARSKSGARTEASGGSAMSSASSKSQSRRRSSKNLKPNSVSLNSTAPIESAEGPQTSQVSETRRRRSPTSRPPALLLNFNVPTEAAVGTPISTASSASGTRKHMSTLRPTALLLNSTEGTEVSEGSPISTASSVSGSQGRRSSTLKSTALLVNSTPPMESVEVPPASLASSASETQRRRSSRLASSISPIPAPRATRPGQSSRNLAHALNPKEQARLADMQALHDMRVRARRSRRDKLAAKASKRGLVPEVGKVTDQSSFWCATARRNEAESPPQDARAGIEVWTNDCDRTEPVSTDVVIEAGAACRGRPLVPDQDQESVASVHHGDVATVIGDDADAPRRARRLPKRLASLFDRFKGLKGRGRKK